MAARSLSLIERGEAVLHHPEAVKHSFMAPGSERGGARGREQRPTTREVTASRPGALDASLTCGLETSYSTTSQEVGRTSRRHTATVAPDLRPSTLVSASGAGSVLRRAAPTGGGTDIAPPSAIVDPGANPRCVITPIGGDPPAAAGGRARRRPRLPSHRAVDQRRLRGPSHPRKRRDTADAAR